ncbi:MAG TPA: exodeoxyribonuclease VII small subunit [Dehalococcoidia bacterium]|nr:exodeoxyribonuclease VII small subunit [Dehalococcoidia bacterium]
MTNATEIKQQTFEAVYTQLEETVRQLEAGGLPLDEAIALFEEGMRLAQRCRELLDGAELRVTTLGEAFRAGSATPEDEEDRGRT